MAVEIDIRYEGQLRCGAVHGPSRQALTTDAPVDNGGKGEAFSPTDLVATAMGTCVMTIMGLVAQRQGVDLSGTRIHVTKEMAQAPVRRISAIRVTVTLPAGLELGEADRVRIENGARSCPVRQSLHPDVETPIVFVYPPTA